MYIWCLHYDVPVRWKSMSHDTMFSSLHHTSKMALGNWIIRYIQQHGYKHNILKNISLLLNNTSQETEKIGQPSHLSLYAQRVVSMFIRICANITKLTNHTCGLCVGHDAVLTTNWTVTRRGWRRTPRSVQRQPGTGWRWRPRPPDGAGDWGVGAWGTVECGVRR